MFAGRGPVVRVAFMPSDRLASPVVDTPPLSIPAISRDVDRLREQLVLLAVECPYTKSNPSTCPLHDVRLLEPAAIIDWLDGLSSEERDFLTLYHQCCLVTKWECNDLEGRQNPIETAAPKGKLKSRRKILSARSQRTIQTSEEAQAARRSV